MSATTETIGKIRGALSECIACASLTQEEIKRLRKIRLDFLSLDMDIHNRLYKETFKTYAQRVQELEEEGCTTSDAQSVADVEVIKGLIKASNDL